MTDAAARLIVGPFNRVEGDLEITLDVADGHVREARVTAPMYRGFEQILNGRVPEDALVIAPRVCGICSVSHSVAASRALAQLSGVEMPANGRLATDLVLACENAADLLTHFALFFMPDFARPAYAHHWWHQTVHAGYGALRGSHQSQLVAARAKFLHIMGLLAGKWPHTLAIQPGGTTKSVDASERIRLLGLLAEFRAVLEGVVYAVPLETIATLDSLTALDGYADAGPAEHGDFRLFLHVARDLELDRLGRGAGTFLSHGGFGMWQDGVLSDGLRRPFDATELIEDLSHAWMDGPNRPAAEKPGAYSWCKAPRLAGKAVEVGALARQLVSGDPLAQGLWSLSGGSVRDRVVMRMVELARLVIAMEGWTRALAPGAPFCVQAPLPSHGKATGLVEAARGALGHWLTVDGGVITAYQIIAPTTWNFSPRDARDLPGPLEQALVGTPVLDGETTPIAVQHVVRSFDPCMACTVH